MDTELVNTPFGQFHAFKDDHPTDRLKEFGAFQRNGLDMIMSVIQPGDCVVDVGAHIGTFAIPIGKSVGELGHVYAFEALANNYELLTKNITLNKLDDNVSAILAVITDSPGKYGAVTKDSNSAYTFLTECDHDTRVASRCIALDAFFEQSRRHDAPERIHFMKIDVEGMELSVLKSCDRILSDDQPALFVEINRPHLDRRGIKVREIDRFLRSRGYVYFRDIGSRRSPISTYRIGRLPSLTLGGTFFDVLAIHRDSDRLPSSTSGALRTSMKGINQHLRRTLRSALRR